MQPPQWANVIRTLRVRRGLSQAVLAGMLGVDQKSVSRWERGLDQPKVSTQRRLLDIYRGSRAARQDEVIRARTRNALWPVSLVGAGSVFLEISRPALAEVGLPMEDVRLRSIYGLFGPEVDEVTHRWEESGIFKGDIAMTMSLNTLGPVEAPIHIQTLDTPHFTADGGIWCLCEIRRVSTLDHAALAKVYGATTVSVPFDDMA